MPVPFTGGCTCGAIRYECSAKPLASVNCHCRDCQHASGSAYTSAVVVPTSALTILKGAAKFYDQQGDSGETVGRGFCPECGSRLFSKRYTMNTLIGIAAGSLDDPSWHQPLADFCSASAQP